MEQLQTVEQPQRGSGWRELSDATLLLYLRQALRAHEQPPPQVTQLAKASFGLRRLDAELASLVDDSVDGVVCRQMRSAPVIRMVRFEASVLTIAVELAPTGSGWRLLGQLDPPWPATVELRRFIGGSVIVTEADRLGRFSLDVSEVGPACLLCRRINKQDVVTSWVLLG